MTDFLLAPGLDGTTTGLLVAASFLTSMTTAALSLGGGAMMIAIMSLVWPAAVAVPMHGVVQLGSNAGRAAHRAKFIQWSFAGWFLVGSAVGSVAGGTLAVSLPDHIFRGIIGAFLLFAAWGPKAKTAFSAPMLVTASGAIASFLGMLVGASGPIVAGFLQHLSDRRALVGTHAALMVFQHIFKIVVFVVLGFGFAPYLPIAIAMIASGFAGTLVGGQLLDRLPERAFRLVFRAILTLIALDLLRRAIFIG